MQGEKACLDPRKEPPILYARDVAFNRAKLPGSCQQTSKDSSPPQHGHCPYTATQLYSWPKIIEISRIWRVGTTQQDVDE
jgi:hypothetical protein